MKHTNSVKKQYRATIVAPTSKETEPTEQIYNYDETPLQPQSSYIVLLPQTSARLFSAENEVELPHLHLQPKENEQFV
jgi:hypothetical protein